MKQSKEALSQRLLAVIHQSAWGNIEEDTNLYNQKLKNIKELLAAGADPNYVYNDLPVLYYAGNCIKPSGLPEWHSVPDPENYRYDVVKLLLEHGANPDTMTPVMATTFLWTARKDIHLAQLFLEYNANPNAQAYNAGKPFYSILKGITGYTNNEPIELAKKLLEHGADPFYPRNEKHTSALDHAIAYGNQPIITLYEQAGVKKLL